MRMHLVERDFETLASIEIPDKFFSRLDTGSETVNTALGGGIVRGSMYVLSGNPGSGKSTWSLMLLDNIRRQNGIRCMYVCGEESKYMVKLRMQRINENYNNVYIQGDFLMEENTDLDQLIKIIDRTQSKVIVIDSLQKLSCQGKRGNKAILAAMEKLYTYIKMAGDVTFICICQSNKSGQFAGLQAFIHEADAHIHMHAPGERTVEKNRHGESRIDF